MRNRYFAWARAGLVLIVMAVASCAKAETTITVAVFDFECASERESMQGFGRALREMLVTDLACAKEIQLVERARWSELAREIDLSKSDRIDPTTAARLGKSVGAKAVLVGGVVAQGDTMRIDARLVDVESGRIILADSITGKVGEFYTLEKNLANRIVVSLGVKLSSFEKKRIAAIQTKDIQAVIEYGRSLESMDAGEVEQAESLVKSALKRDGAFALAKDLLARIDAMVVQLSDANLDQDARLVAGIEWLLENAPTYKHDCEPFAYTVLYDIYPHDAFSRERYDALLKEKGAAAALGYKLERIVVDCLHPEYAFRNPPSFKPRIKILGAFFPTPEFDKEKWDISFPPFIYAFETLINYLGQPGLIDCYQSLGLIEECFRLIDAFEQSEFMEPKMLDKRNRLKEKLEKELANKDADVTLGDDWELKRICDATIRYHSIRKSLLITRISLLLDTLKLDEAEKLIDAYRKNYPDDAKTALALGKSLQEAGNPKLYKELKADSEKLSELAAKARPRIAAIKREMECAAERGRKDEEADREKRIDMAKQIARRPLTIEQLAEYAFPIYITKYSARDQDALNELLKRESQYQEHYIVDFKNEERQSRMCHVYGCRHVNMGQIINGETAYGSCFQPPEIVHSEKEAADKGYSPCPQCLGGQDPLAICNREARMSRHLSLRHESEEAD